MPDAITVELLRNAFNSIALEMNANLARSAFSPIIYEMKDCSVGLFNEHAVLLGQAPGLPIFLGALDEAVKIVHRHFAPHGIYEGDVYALNDPYLTGSHLNDVTVISPIFYEGELVGFTATKAHWLDIGGKDMGVSVDTTEIYQEGLRLGPTRLFTAGQPERDILDILARNSRLPHSIMGDLNAQVAACRTGERRYRDVLRRFGLATVRQATKEIFSQAERADREAIAEIPKGVYRAEGYLDSDGHSPEPIPIRVTVTVRASNTIEIDLTGSSPQRQGCTNCGMAQTISAARLAYKFLINPHHPPNGGHFRALTVKAPAGSIFAAQEPAACLYYAPQLGVMIELVLRALSEAMPDRVPAGQPSDQMNFMMAGAPPGEPPFITGEASAVGWGALPTGDGLNAVVNYMAGDLKNLPAEVEEAKYPLRVGCRALEPDSGGAGRFRGGLAMVKEYVPTAGSRLLLWLERTVTPGWGTAGGYPGRTARCLVAPGSPQEKSLKKANHLPIATGTTVRCYTAGGGGYGPPWERDVQRVLEDIYDGYITREAAERDYGLRFIGNSLMVDQAATLAAREELATKRREVA